MGKADVYVEYLKDEGYKPVIDSDGDVAFKYEGGNYFIIAAEDDPMYFQLLYPNFWEVSDPALLDKVYRAAGQATRETKVAKVYVNRSQDKVSATIEVYIKEPQDCGNFLKRALVAVRHAVKEFISVMEAP